MNPQRRCLLLTLVVLVGCSRPETKIDVGTPKHDVLRSLGKPTNWVSVPTRGPRKHIGIATLFSVESLLATRMPPDEIWILEYTRADGGKYCLHLRDEKVTALVEGAALKE